MPESAHLSHLGPDLSQLNAASFVGWACSRTGSCSLVLPSGPVSSQVLPEYAIVFKERAIINPGDHMGQHPPPGFITRSVPARAGKGGDQGGFIHRLILMQCLSILRRKLQERRRTRTPYILLTLLEVRQGWSVSSPGVSPHRTLEGSFFSTSKL